jgi:protein farnesyltransferase subunit beta
MIELETSKSWLDYKELCEMIRPLINEPLQPLKKEVHINYLHRALDRSYGPEFLAFDCIRPWLCFWSLHSLEILKAPLSQDLIDSFTHTIGLYQNKAEGGFGGKPGIIPHLACTYASISCLCILGTGYELVDTVALYSFLKKMKRPDGGFNLYENGEHDHRGVYCALVCGYLCNILDEELTDKCEEYILSCQNWQGGFGSRSSHCEAHAGYTFCATASLAILAKYHSKKDFSFGGDKTLLLEYCKGLQDDFTGGFAGRVNKLVDGCYSFWVPGVLKMLEPFDDAFDTAALEKFILNVCQNSATGGFRDKPGKKEDLYHTCYCLSGLSLLSHRSLDLLEIDPIFNVGIGKPIQMRQYFINK